MDADLKERYRMAELIAGKIAGILSDEEITLLEKWRQASPGHEKEYERIIQRLKTDLRDTHRLDRGREWELFENKLPRKRRILRAWYAVAAAVLVAMVTIVVFRTEKVEPATPLAETVSKGMKERKAILILGNGERINISDSTLNVLVETGGTEVFASGDIIKYNRKDTMNLSTVEYNTLVIPRGGEYELELADGTRVWLNSESKLIYPVRVSGDIREVQMEGEICFQVAKNEKQPFIVKTKDVAVKVLGTLFNMEAYSDTRGVVTTLVEGRINVSNGQGERVVEPGQQVVATGDELVVTEVDAEQFISWTRGICFFNEASLEEIMEKLGRWYDMEVFFVSPSLKEAHFSLEIKRYDNIADVLGKIEKTGRMKFKVNGRTVMVEE